MATTKAVLIVGGSGFVGTHLALKLREGYKVFATYHSRHFTMPGVTTLPLNISNQNGVKRVVYTTQPDVVIYAAGSNRVDVAENHPREAERIHTGGPATVSNASEIIQAKFIYLSNCYIFDGHRGNYHENDTVMPSAALGKGKLGGENFIRGRSLNYSIVRSSPLLGIGNGRKPSFLDILRTRLDRGQRVDLPAAELHSFAPVAGLVEVISRLVETGSRNKTYHYGGLTKITDYELAKNFASRFGYNSDLITLSRYSKGTAHSSDSFYRDFSLNSSQTAESLKVKPLLLEECFDLIQK